MWQPGGVADTSFLHGSVCNAVKNALTKKIRMQTQIFILPEQDNAVLKKKKKKKKQMRHFRSYRQKSRDGHMEGRMHGRMSFL